ncbi:MAG TPA: glycosyltransferase [Bacteroidia bacterium]|nr:glycosyltransferase [Bacteroidia bacterium]
MMEIFYLLLFLSSLLFSFFILSCYFSWIKVIEEPENPAPGEDPVSIVIAARNEAEHIHNCLSALSKQDYKLSLLEIVVVDDNSEDETKLIVEEFRLRHPEMNIRLLEVGRDNGGSKKSAINFAIKYASSDIILMTDADCIAPVSWVSAMINYFKFNACSFLAGPVSLSEAGGIFQKVQSLEFMGLVGIAASGIYQKNPIMCNGANLMFSKKLFFEVKGFDSELKLASGDDTQLLLKASKKYPDNISFLKDRRAIVLTQSSSSLHEFVEQRKRWAGKIPFALTAFTIFIAIISWLTHALLIVGLADLISEGTINKLGVISFIMVCLSEFVLLNSLARFFRKRMLLWLFLPAQFFYWIYIVLIGVIAPLSTFSWKGRTTH